MFAEAHIVFVFGCSGLRLAEYVKYHILNAKSPTTSVVLPCASMFHVDMCRRAGPRSINVARIFAIQSELVYLD